LFNAGVNSYRTMTDQNSFDGKVVKKVPYVTPTLFALGVLFAIIFVVGYIPLHLTDYSTLEFRTIVFMTLYQGVFGDITFGSLFLAIIFYILHLKIRQKVPVTLTIDQNAINIKGPKYNRKIDIEYISEIRCHDHLNYKGFSKEKFSLFIKSKNRKSTYFFLKDYTKADKLFDLLGERNIKLEVYNSNSGEFNDDE